MPNSDLAFQYIEIAFRGPDDERLADIAWAAPWRSSASSDGTDRVGRQQYLYLYFMGYLSPKNPLFEGLPAKPSLAEVFRARFSKPILTMYRSGNLLAEKMIS